MSFEDNKAFWEEFITLYQEKPCLWDIKSKEYRNKQLKNAAYNVLIKKCKELFPDANKDFVIKKISSLRASFRRQIRRINNAKKSPSATEDVPEATLWYFDLLSFLPGQEQSRSEVSSLQQDNFKKEPQETDTSTQELSLYSELPSPLSSPETPQSRTSSSRKRTLSCTSWTKKGDQFLDTSLRVLEEEDIATQAEKRYITEEVQEVTFGRNVGQQLQEVEPRQRIIAQKLISDVLFHAKMGNLNDFSLISLSSQPTPSQSFPYVRHSRVVQQTCMNFPIPSNRSDASQPTSSFVRQPEESQHQISSNLKISSDEPCIKNPNAMAEFLYFPKQN